MSFRPARALFLCLWAAGVPPLRAAEPDVVISEFMAVNRATLRDRDGDYSDWIELHNRGTNAASLDGWFLTDAAASLRRWRLPAYTLLPNEYLLVFASGKNRTNLAAPLHANFQLARDGEYLALVRPDGATVASEFAPAYPEQRDDVSYGRERTAPDAVGWFAQPTPGGPNATSGPGFAPAVRFSVPSSAFVDAFPLALACDDPAAELRYTLDGTAPGAGSPLYAAPLAITNRVQVRARAYVPGRLPGPVRTEAYLWIAPAMRNVTSDLPILVVDTFGRTVPDTGDLRAHLWVFEPRGGRTSLANPPTLAARIATDRRGSSTGGQPKPNLNVEVRGETDDDLDVELLGLPAESDWVLHAPYNFDPAGFRNPLAYSLSRQVGRYASRHRFAEVYLNTGGSALSQSRYQGLYNVLERIKRGPDRVDVDRLEPFDSAALEVTGGYLFKIDRLGPGENGFSAGGQTFAYVDPREELIRTPQRLPQRTYLTKYLNDLNTALNRAAFSDPVAGYPAFVDVPAAVDHHLLNTFFYNVDALRLSTYLHKPRDGQVTWGPVWDFDRALGSTDGRDAQPRGWNATGGTDFFYYPWWDRMFQDVNFWQRWIDRWQELRDGPLADTNLFVRIDALNAEIREASARDFSRWQQPKRGGSQAGEVAHLKRWLTNRADFIDTNFIRRPLLGRPPGRITPGELLTLTAPTNATIWYTLDGSDPRAPGGGFTPAARRYDAPLTLATTFVVRARAYNPAHNQRTGHPNPPVRSLWSGITTARYTADRPAGPGDLAVTEINFHPPDPTPSELASLPGITDDDFEFLELKNLSPEAVDLFDLRFTEGIGFGFATNRLNRLAPGAHLLLVRNPAAFTLRHGLHTTIAGTLTGGLANTGEQLRATDAAGQTVLDVTWRDDWHAATDGRGFTLVVRGPGGVRPPWGAAPHWRASA
ncbi:MAG: CotH kinase family protein, partial [Limisphaerales bacterium]